MYWEITPQAATGHESMLLVKITTGRLSFVTTDTGAAYMTASGMQSTAGGRKTLSHITSVICPMFPD